MALRNKKFKRFYFFSFGAGLLLGLMMTLGWVVWATTMHHLVSKNNESSVSGLEDLPAVPINVKITKAKTEQLPQIISAVGHMQAMQSADLSFEVAGVISQIIVQKGRVKAGEVLMRLNDQVDQAQLASDEAALSLNQSTYDRFLKLSQMGDESAQILEEKKAALLTAQAAVAKDKAILAEKALVAPFDGVLGTTNLTVGSYVAAGQSIIKLVQLAPLKVSYSVPASFKPEMEIGQTVKLTTEDYPNQIFNGLVSYIDPSVDTQSGTLNLEAKVDNPDFVLSPGMFVEIQQVINPDRILLVIPDIALMTDIGGRYVFTVMPDKKNKLIAKKQYVTVGLIQNGVASITQGLKAGDDVVIAGQQRLYDGYPINLIN